MSARVLVVDDSVVDREFVKATLRDAGYTVVGEAASGEEAVARYGALMPDVVVMDLVMPRLSGTDAARRILSAHPSARILAMSGLSQPSVQSEAMDAGMLGFIPKPLDRADLLAEVADAIAGSAFFSGTAAGSPPNKRR